MTRRKEINYNETFFRLVNISIGNLLCAIGINLFFSPNRLLSGGLTGIALIVQYLIGIPSGIIVFIANIPIFILGAKKVDRDFILFSVLSTIIYSILLTLTSNISDYILIDDIFVGAFAGGALSGIGLGIVFRNRASQGGADVIAAILKKNYNMNIGNTLILINIVIITLSSFLFGIIPAIYTVVSTIINGVLVDKIQIGFDVKKSVTVVSDNYTEIGERLMEELNRSITYIDAVGGYKKEDKKLIYCIVMSKEISKLKEVINSIDDKSFIIIHDVVEVEGSTFKRIGI